MLLMGCLLVLQGTVLFLMVYVRQWGWSVARMSVLCRVSYGAAMVISGIGLLFLLKMCRLAKCPYCGRNLLSKGWNYGQIRRIRNRRPIICPHCEEELETD